MSRAKGPTEDQIQQAVMQWSATIKYKGRRLSDYLHHSPNGGSRHIVEAVKFKRMGVKAGYPDLILDIARDGFHGLRIELKTEVGKLSKIQKERLKMLSDEGYCAVVCHGFDDAIKAIEFYMREGK